MIKSAARKVALENRKHQSIEISSKRVLDEILSSKLLEDYSHIGIYYPIGNEINIMSLVELFPNKKFYLPITKEEIIFAEYCKHTKLQKGPFHTMEPISNVVSRDCIELFLIPCVAINKNKQRIGYGKGYYDRYLAGYSGVMIGICYEKDSCMDVSCDSYDIKLNQVIVG